MSTIYLYLKTHNATGLKYLGKTIQDPIKYNGSGKRWLNHIKTHGNCVTTEILLETESSDEISKAGLYYSELWDVANSKEFANLIPETGSGGDTSQFVDYEDPIRRKRISASLKGRATTPGSWTTETAKAASERGNKRKREMLDSGETSHWKSKKGVRTTSTLGHKWYRNLETGERQHFINKDVPDGWVTSDEYREINRKSNTAWFHDTERNYLIDRNDDKIKSLGLVPGRKKF